MTLATYVMRFFTPFHVRPDIYYRVNKISFPATQRKPLEMFHRKSFLEPSSGIEVSFCEIVVNGS